MSFEWLYLYTLPFMVVITIVVFFHELGHYLLARFNGVRVEVFSIGFGPELFGFTNKAGTRWKFSLLPLGGYVKMAGDADAASRPDHGAYEKMTKEQKQESLMQKNVWQRISVSAAGPIANYIFAIVVLAILYAVVGQSVPADTAKLGMIIPDSPAAQAGLQINDEVVAIDGQPVKTFEELRQIVMDNPEQALDLTVRRPGQQLSISLVPSSITVKDDSGQEKKVGQMGAWHGADQVMRPIYISWYYATVDTFVVTGKTFQALGQMIIGQRGAKELKGPLGIAQLTGKIAATDFATFCWFIAFISMNLGLINLLPIPMLDGGHLLFYGIEAIRGKPLSERAQEYGFRIGFLIVLSLMLFATWNDLENFHVIAWVKGLFGW